MTSAELMEHLLEQAMIDGYVTCQECGNNIEIDTSECPCGWINPVYM